MEYRYDWRPRYETAGDTNLGRLLLSLETLHRDHDTDRDYRDFRVISVVKDDHGLYIAVYTYEAFVTI